MFKRVLWLFLALVAAVSLAVATRIFNPAEPLKGDFNA